MQKELFKKVRPSPSHIPAIPLTHPCNSPHALKGQKLLAQGIRPGYSCSHTWRPVGAKALYDTPNMIYKPKKKGEKMM